MGRGSNGRSIAILGGAAIVAGALLAARGGRAEPAPALLRSPSPSPPSPSPPSPSPPFPSPPSPSHPPSTRPPIFHGVRPFMGLLGATGVVIMRLPTGDEVDSIFSAQVPTALFALKAGVLLGRAELGIELAPFTQLYWYIPTAEAHIYGGYHVRLSEKVSWPARLGLGVLMSAHELELEVYTRVDPVGVSIQAEPCLIDVYLLSLRMTPLPSRGADRPGGFILSTLAGVGVSWPL